LPGADKDVDRAIATFGGTSIAYHTFSPELGEPDAPAPGSAAEEFPLLLSALPEVAGIPVPQRSSAAPAPVSQDVEAFPLPKAETLSPEPTAPRREVTIAPQPPSVPSNGSLNASGAYARAKQISVDAAFRILKSEPVQVKQPRDRRPGLQDLLRRL